MLEPPVLSTLPAGCAAVQSGCERTYQSCLTAKSACQCLTDFSQCLTGCHTPQLVSALSRNCSLSYCDAACPLPTSADMVERLIDASVDNLVSLPSGEGVFIPEGALASSTKIGVQVMSAVPRVPGHQGLTIRSRALSFSPSGQTFQKEVTLAIRFNGAVPGAGRRLAIFKHNTQTLDWNEKTGSELLATDRVVRAKTRSFSTYAVFELDEDPPPQPPPPPPASAPMMGPWQIVALSVAIIFCVLLVLVCTKCIGKDEEKAKTRAKVERDAQYLEPTIVAEDPVAGVPEHAAMVEVQEPSQGPSADSSTGQMVQHVTPIKISTPPVQVFSKKGGTLVMSDDETPPETPRQGAPSQHTDEHQPSLHLFVPAMASAGAQRRAIGQNVRRSPEAFSDERQPNLDLMRSAVSDSDSIPTTPTNELEGARGALNRAQSNVQPPPRQHATARQYHTFAV